MTNETDTFLTEALALWSGRFRFPGLLVALSDGRPTSPEDLALLGLEGIAADCNEYQTFLGLISTGEFQVAEEALAECQALDTAQIDELRTRLRRRRAECLQNLLGTVQQLLDRAGAAEVDFDLDRGALIALCERSWPQVQERLQAKEDALWDSLRDKRATLRARCEEVARRAGEWDDALGWQSDALRGVSTLLEAGQLRAVELLLASGASPRPGPESVPPLRGWSRVAESPSEVMQWHLNAALRPRTYERWAPADQRGQELLEAFEALGDNTEAAAAQFARALARLLDTRPEEPPAVSVHRVDGGYLATITGVFADAEISRFRPADRAELFIADPETRERPELRLQQPYIAVGRSLSAADAPERGACAVLDLGHLVELVTLRSHVGLQLLRVLGRQWPLAAFTGGSVASLETLIGSEPGERWHVLRWIIDLAGLGDLTTADALAFQVGDDPALLHLFLEFLARKKRAERSRSSAYDDVRGWSKDPQFARTVEKVVLSPITDSPAAQVAFWAALSAAVPGQTVTLDEILLSAATIAGDEMADNGHVSEIRRGLARLEALPLVVSAGEEEVHFDRCGVLLVLAGDADRKVQDALFRLTEQVTAAREGNGRPLSSGDWRLYRHALRPELRRYRELADTPTTTPEELTEVANELIAGSAELPAASVDGVSDVTATLGEMEESFAAHYPEIKLQIHAPDSSPVAVSVQSLQVILYELLTNAAEACTGHGEQTVRATVTPLGTEFVVDVQDSGPGLAYTEGTEHVVFRKGESSRGPDRGLGLYNARRLARGVDGDLSVRSRALGHPVLRGAHFQLLLPRA
ncbi:ATP-binding protein [Streptomyces sp. PTD9-10]|uniref:ATP-binding protein n=1 Tax=Streptomyces sp. PTD9-10 TaxID=3120151 RepID=UPI00300AECE9